MNYLSNKKKYFLSCLIFLNIPTINSFWDKKIVICGLALTTFILWRKVSSLEKEIKKRNLFVGLDCPRYTFYQENQESSLADIQLVLNEHEQIIAKLNADIESNKPLITYLAKLKSKVPVTADSIDVILDRKFNCFEKTILSRTTNKDIF